MALSPSSRRTRQSDRFEALCNADGLLPRSNLDETLLGLPFDVTDDRVISALFLLLERKQEFETFGGLGSMQLNTPRSLADSTASYFRE